MSAAKRPRHGAALAKRLEADWALGARTITARAARVGRIARAARAARIARIARIAGAARIARIAAPQALAVPSAFVHQNGATCLTEKFRNSTKKAAKHLQR